MTLIFHTVPWAPGLEFQQLGHYLYVALRSTAVIWQVGIRKGFERETVKAKLATHVETESSRTVETRAIELALELGMLEAECDGLAEEFYR